MVDLRGFSGIGFEGILAGQFWSRIYTYEHHQSKCFVCRAPKQVDKLSFRARHVNEA